MGGPNVPVADLLPQGYIEYEIDVEQVLRDELPGVIARAPIAPLTLDAIAAIPEQAKGAYVLYENGVAVYAGKTDTRHGFRSRLSRHHNTIKDRIGLDPLAIGFKAIRIMVFSNFDVEAILIGQMRKSDPLALSWNTSGFGSNDPGHNRERQEPADFDKERPIDIDRPLLFLPPGRIATFDLLLLLKANLPYLFRFETDLNENGKPARYNIGHIDQRDAPPIDIYDDNLTMRQALRPILDALPSEWRATLFPDRVILYREKVHYQYAREYIE